MGRRRFNRTTDTKSYRKLYVLATEGFKTEPLYFSMFNGKNSITKVHCLKDKNASDPKSVLKRMNRYIKTDGLKASDEAWLVVDKDSWAEQQLRELKTWSENKANYGFALSNPKFEYWLLLHFEDGRVLTCRACSERLKKYLPNYDKGFDISKISAEMIIKAIKRAKLLDSNQELTWSNKIGSTVYKLVESILANEKTVR